MYRGMERGREEGEREGGRERGKTQVEGEGKQRGERGWKKKVARKKDLPNSGEEGSEREEIYLPRSGRASLGP